MSIRVMITTIIALITVTVLLMMVLPMTTAKTDPKPKFSSRYFSSVDFACKHCKITRIDDDLLEKLERVRQSLGFPLVITSGYRCSKHNKDVGGSERSSHLEGYAVDVKLPDGAMKLMFITQAIKVGFKRIGVYSKHVHVDVDPRKPATLYWGEY